MRTEGKSWSVYESHVLDIISGISETSKKSMNLISDLDKTSERISAQIDELLQSNEQFKSKEKIKSLKKVLEFLSERKSQIAIKNYDIIDQNIKIIDQEINIVQKAISYNSNYKHKNSKVIIEVASTKPRVGRKRKVPASDQAIIEPFVAIDPNEPVYCLCRRVAFGEMIACDNDECAVEWFHYECVNLTKKPRNTWICPTCVALKER